MVARSGADKNINLKDVWAVCGARTMGTRSRDGPRRIWWVFRGESGLVEAVEVQLAGFA